MTTSASVPAPPQEPDLAAVRDAAGLTSSAAEALLRDHGPNRLAEPVGRTVVAVFVDQFRNLLVVVLIEAGGRVPADGILTEAYALEIDESTLTGESSAVAKQVAGPIEGVALAERTGAAFMNTVVTRAGLNWWLPPPAWVPRRAPSPGCCKPSFAATRRSNSSSIPWASGVRS